MRQWVYNPHTGGVTVPDAVRRRTEERIQAYAREHYAGAFNRIEVRFRGAHCYIDAYTEPEDPSPQPLQSLGETREEHLARLRAVPVHLCRLRYFGDEDRWSMAFYTYSNERYEPSFFNTGEMQGTPEEAFETAAVYLRR
ncbi:MAG TPA: hypothetical protein VFJ58_03490 [Armatimonadota bacterium]|nr:hypothetical protein [Armatimonadota bacterium]